jgi:co-chaperonin GroES (HSP10)
MSGSKSEFLGRFEKAAGTFKLYGSKILVERMEQAEVKSAGGIILAHTGQKEAQFKLQMALIATVLATGNGYYDAESRSYEPLEVKPGNVVMLNTNGVQFYSTLPGSTSYNNQKIGLTTESDIQMIFEDLEAFNAYVKALNNEEGV